MGVTGLWKLLEPSGKPVPLETLENKVLAIDISIWLHQVVKGFQDSKGGTLPNAHLLGLFHRLCKLLFYRVKPVFVFDGGVPVLKRQTIKKRQESKKQFLNSADHLQELLLTALAKERVVQQVLGDSASLLAKSPKKRIEEEKKASRDDMFKLPPMEDTPSAAPVDESFEEKKMSTMTLHSIDVNSAAFKALPADKRYEILTDLKETRKQSSWGRLHELPVQSNDFASFQMKRLLKRHQVQQSLEEAEQEMGGATLSFSELEKMLTEEGVLAAATKSHGQRIANDDVTKFVFVKDVKKALEEAKKAESKDAEEGPSSALGTEFDSDLAKAIAMSLEEEPEEDDEEEHLEGAVKMSEAQKRFLKGTAKSMARTYMMEFGGMSSEDVEELFKESEEETSAVEIPLFDQEVPEEKPIKETVQVISSDSDSDFEEVPTKEDKSSLEVVINPSKIRESLEDDLFSDIFAKKEIEEPKEAEKSPVAEKKSLEVVINPSEVPESVEDDLFSDVFAKKDKAEDSEKSSKPTEEEEQQTVVEDKPLEVVIKPKEDSENQKEEDHKENGTVLEDKVCTTDVINPPESQELRKDSTKKSILEELLEEKKAISSITLDDLPKETSQMSQPEEVIEISDTDEEKTPKKAKKSLDDYFTVSGTPKKEEKVEEDVPKVTSPFFVKKSPRSAKKSPGKSSAEAEKPIVAKELFPEDRDALIQLKDDLVQETKSLESERNKQERLGVSITEKMTHECKQLLRLFGIPYIVAPMEAEAQCAFMNAIELTDGTITDDSDIWLFGGQTVYKNFFDQRKHVLEYRMEKIEKLFKIDRTKLIQMAMLVGSDYTIGINGIGAVTALEILAQFPITDTSETDYGRLSGLKSFKDWWHGSRHTTSKRSVLKGKLNNIVMTEGFPSVSVLRAYLYPHVDDSQEAFVWGELDVESIKEFSKKQFGWPSTRTDELLVPVLKKMKDRKVQPSIKNYFNILTPRHSTEMKVSKRVRKAIDNMSGEPTELATVQEDEEVPKKTRKKPAKKTEEKAPRKRKSDEEPVPSTSKGIPKVARIPNTKAKIPQREKDRAEAQEKMRKAVEAFKKSK
ncbi:DNA excision repair protein ERCC-5 [Phlebotomus argentipes]|uniref:DNA excision repair protein ERCC-5 n=1 Tax=Phlebotomus argentipes TaxID=94469 RepID=UPI002893620D|nr:DNA excision repair protein ERCC-5 [Phlebotomus argentipes]